MDKDEIKKLVNDTIESKLNDMKSKEFRKWRRYDSVVDQFSPITGASSQIGFYSKPKIAQQTVTGSRGSNSALASLLTKLANLGLIIDSSS